MLYLVLKVNNIEIYLFSSKRIREEIPYINYNTVAKTLFSKTLFLNNKKIPMILINARGRCTS